MSNSVDRSRWESLLEDLGLPGENPAPGPVSPHPIDPVSRDIKETATVPSVADVVAKSSSEPPDDEPRNRRRRPSPSQDVSLVPESVAFSEELETTNLTSEEPDESEAAETQPESAPGKSRRRRRTRSARKNRNAPVEAGEVSSVASTVDAENSNITSESDPDASKETSEGETANPAGEESEQPGRSRRRRRSRSRKRGKKVAVEAGAEPLEVATKTPVSPVAVSSLALDAPEPLDEEANDEEPIDDSMEDDTVPRIPRDDDDEELDDLSNWTVPSWQDLISSLYRPDR